MLTILGIDPGKEGGFAIVNADSVIVEPMPQTKDGEIDIPELVRLLTHYAPEITAAYLEAVQPMPTNGSIGSFKLGQSLGMLQGILAALQVRVHLVRPRTWSDAYPHGVTEQERGKREKAIKVARRGIVAELYPGIDLRKTARSAVPHEGMVDALLIADYGIRINQTTSREEPKR